MEDLRCTNCDKKLDEKKTKWLELSTTDGYYYLPEEFPENHLSQGGFPFGIACAKKEIKKINNKDK